MVREEKRKKIQNRAEGEIHVNCDALISVEPRICGARDLIARSGREKARSIGVLRGFVEGIKRSGKHCNNFTSSKSLLIKRSMRGRYKRQLEFVGRGT